MTREELIRERLIEKIEGARGKWINEMKFELLLNQEEMAMILAALKARGTT